MKTVVGRIMGGAVALTLSLLACGADLNLDGMMMVKGMSMSGARIIMLTPDQEPRLLTSGLDHFTLRLDLNKEYLLSFEREGCVSKQLQFNTSVPEGYPVGQGFYFPFQVTLEPMPKGQRFSYAGPVGSIHFDKYINAFGYDTDYRVAKDEVLTERLELARTEIDRKVSAGRMATGIAVGETPSTSAAKIEPSTQRTPYEVLAPTVSRTAPMVHVLEMPVDQKSAPNYAKPMHAALEELRPDRPEPELLAQNIALVGSPVMAPTAQPSYRWKDVQADRLHVITTIKVTEAEGEVQYRRVVSYYGGITYFRNGLPCSEGIYQLGIAY